MRALQSKSKSKADRPPQSKRFRKSLVRDELCVRVTGRAIVILAMAVAAVLTAAARSVLAG